jgi:hypothetical protein
MNRSCETCLRGPKPEMTSVYCLKCGDDLVNYIHQPMELEAGARRYLTNDEGYPLDLAETRIDIIGSNGNDGLHYEQSQDPVNHPVHYTSHPSGIECIEITEHMGFCLGNAIKYIWRADEKGADIEDLQKAAWYIAREIALRSARASHA